MASHLLAAGVVLALAGGEGAAGGGGVDGAVFAATVTVAGVVALLVCRRVVMFPLLGAPAVTGCGDRWVRLRLPQNACEDADDWGESDYCCVQLDRNPSNV